MLKTIRRSIAHPALAIGSTLLWGVVELVALQRAARTGRIAQRRSSNATTLHITETSGALNEGIHSIGQACNRHTSICHNAN